MANKIKVDVEVTSNIDEQTRSAKVLRKELESAKRISGDSSRAAGDTKAFAAAAEAAASSTERLGYGIARAAVGTGAAGRDFAKQAQGLGGLVHVYATFAANLFAVGAAFTALKNAADTTSMIKGLDQLGAASGRGLGTLAKDIVALTDGAVTLREAMEATAKATAAGMSSEDLKRLAVGAKNASQALGVDMSDALSRLSRGITKLEPELLDELGIFVRVDKAASEYARTLGKPASALTDFEKRAGFAAATLEQVEKKFGAIKLDSNPYNQLLASLKQVVQTGLEVVNSVLEPILRMLSSSPTALAAAMGLVGTALLRQAIPALGSMRESMRASAEEATKIANFKSAEAKRARVLELKEVKAAAESSAEIRLAATELAQKRIAESQINGFKKSTKAYQILNMDWQDVEEKHFNELQKQADRFEKSNPEVSNRYKAAIGSLREYIDAEKNYLVVEKKVQEEMAKTHGLLSTQGQLQAAAERANQAAASRMIVSNAAYTASLSGPVAAWKKLNSEIAKARSTSQTVQVMLPQFDTAGMAILDEQGKQVTALEEITTKKMGVMRAGWTRLTGAIGITTSVLGNAMNAFGIYAAVIGALTAVMSIVIDKFSATSKESKLTAEALDGLSSASENAERVLVRLRDIDPLERFSVQSIQARATALNELAAAFGTSINRVYDEMKKMNTLDKTVDFFKGLFNTDIADNLADNLSEGIVYAFKLAGQGTASKQAEDAIRNILGDVDLKDEAALKSALEPLIKGGPIAQAKVEQVNAAIKKLGIEAGTAAAKGTELTSAIEVTAKAFQDVATSFVPSDNISKLGLALLAEAAKFSAAIDEPQQKLLALKAILESPVQMSLLPPEVRDNLVQYNEELTNLINASSMYDVAIENTNQELQKMQKLYGEVDKAGPWSGNEAQLSAISAKIIELTDYIDKYKDAKISIKADIEARTGSFSDIGTQMFQKGAELIGNRLSAEFAKAASVITKAAASLAPDTITGITLGTRADQAQLEIEKQMINVQITLVKSMHDLQQATELANLLKQKELEESKLFGKDQARIDALNNSITRLQKGIEATKSAGFAGSPGALKDLAAQGVDQATITLATQLLSMKAELGGKSAQQAANAIAEQGKLIDQRSAASLKELEAVKELDRLELDRLGNIKGVDGIISGELLKRKQTLELSTAQADADAKIIKAQADVEKFQLMINTAKLQGNAKAQEELGTLEKVLETAKSNKQTTIDTITAKQKYDMESNAIAREKQLLDLEVQRSNVISSLGILADTETVRLQAQLEMRNLLRQQMADAKNLEIQLNQVIAQQEATSDAAKRASLQQTIDALRQQQTEEQAVYDKKIQTLDAMNRVRIVQSQTVELATSLNAIFSGMNNSVGEFATTTIKAFESMKSAAALYTEELAKNEAQRKKVQEDTSLPEDEREKKLKDLSDEESRLKKKSIKDELTGNAAILGSAKKLFNEKSASYKILASMEKAMHIAKLVMWGVEMAMEAKAAITSIMFSKAEQAESVATMTTNAGEAVTNQGKGDPYSAFARIAAMVGIMAAVLAAFGGGGGGGASISVPSMPTAEQLQEVQGTGQDYQAGTLNLLANGGGVLGDIAAKSEDIANSIDYIESHSFETLVYNNKMLEALKGIEVNTSQFVASLAQAGIIGINSPFGTQATASGGGSPGFLGMFGSSSSTSREVTDFGVKITGALGDLIKGIGQYLVYETVKTVTTKSSSGFFGIGGGSSTSTSYATEYRTLEDQVIGTLRVLFINASNAIVSSADRLGVYTVDQIEQRLAEAQINLDISTFGLTGEEALADVMAEIGVELNKVVAVAYPFLTEFQRLGEGLTTTLARVTTDMQTVDVMFKQMGVNFVDKFLSNITSTWETKTIESWEKIANEWETVDLTPGTKVKYGANDSFAYGEVGDSGSVAFVNQVFGDPIEGIFKAGYKLVENIVTEETITATQKKVAIYEDLIDKFGGDIDQFIEKTQFYVDNFIDQNTVYLAHLDSVGAEMARLGYASVDTKREFVDLVNSLDLATESGRQLYAELMNVAPGFDVINQHLADLISNAGMAADDFADILMDAITGNSTIAEAGTKVAETISDGILTAVASSYVTSISTAFNDLIITPIVSAVTTGATLTNIISTQAITEIRNIALGAANAIAVIFKDPAFVTAIKEATTLIGDTIKQMAAVTQITTGSISKIIAKYNTKLIDAYKKQASEIQSTLNKFKGFSDSLKEFRDSLLTGALSPKTPLEKYNLALQDLDQTYALAMKGDETAIARLKTVAQTFLDMSREYYASSDAYVSDFDRVQRILDSTIGLVDTQVSDLERQLQVAQDQLAVLGYIDETTKTIAELLAEANAGQKEEVGNVLSSGFTVLDKNFDGLLTLDELKTSGLASDSELQKIFTTIDTNGDGQISMLESLKASTEGTTFGVNSLAPILEGIRNGTLSVKDAIDYLAQLNIANVGSGGTPIAIDTAASEEMRLAWVQQYVQGAYRDILNREAEAGGLQYWTDQIISGKLAITDLYATISQSDEAINLALKARVEGLDAYIENAYTMLLDRAPDAEGLAYWKEAIESNRMSIEDLYSTFTRSDEYLANMSRVVSEFNSIMSSVGSSGFNIPGFANGGYHSGGLRIVGENGPELEATGEARIWTAQQTQQILSSTDLRNTSNGDLIVEIQRLNQKIESLERTVQQGDIMNAQATERNTQQVSTAVKDTGSTTVYANKLQSRATIV